MHDSLAFLRLLRAALAAAQLIIQSVRWQYRELGRLALALRFFNSRNTLL